MSNIDVALIGDLAALYSEYDVTNWVWPRQDYSLNSWNEKIKFNLESQYTFLVGKIYNDSIQLTPFSSWINAKILMRAWDYNSSNKTYWNIINWIDFDQRNGIAILNKSKIIAADSVIIGFQAQSYTFLDSDSLENIVTELQKVTFIFVNKNTDIENMDNFKYLISGKIKNITISLIDNEDDITFIKAASTSGINVFVSSTQQKNTYTLIWLGLSNETSLENITLSYYDSYHSDPTLRNILTLEMNVFVSEPPNFISEPNSITLQMWSKYIYKLPNVSDPENDPFSINVIGNNSYWATFATPNSSKYDISIDTSLLGLLEEDTKNTIEIKLEDTTGAYIVYYWNITVLHYSIPYFDLIPNVSIMNFKNENINYRINTYFDIFQNDYKIYAEECYTKNIIPWITNNPNSNNTSMIINVSKTNIGDYWVKLVVQFTWKNIIR